VQRLAAWPDDARRHVSVGNIELVTLARN